MKSIIEFEQDQDSPKTAPDAIAIQNTGHMVNMEVRSAAAVAFGPTPAQPAMTIPLSMKPTEARALASALMGAAADCKK